VFAVTGGAVGEVREDHAGERRDVLVEPDQRAAPSGARR